MSCYDLDLWPVDLESLWYIWWHVVIVCTKFDRNRTICDWVIHNLANFCSRHVSLWPWRLTPWPWSFVVLRTSCVQTLCKISAISNNRRQSYSRFSTFSPSNFWQGPKSPNTSQGCVDRIAPNLQGTHRDHCSVTSLFQISDILLRFQTQAAQSRAILKSMPNLAPLTPCKSYGLGRRDLWVNYCSFT